MQGPGAYDGAGPADCAALMAASRGAQKEAWTSCEARGLADCD